MPPVVASADHDAALCEARRLAASAGRAPASADVLVGILRAGGAAARLLAQRGVAAPALEAVLGEVRPDNGFDLGTVDRTSYDVAGKVGATHASSMHLLIALLRGGGSAEEILRRSGHDPVRIRSVAVRAVTGPSRIGERLVPRGSSDRMLAALPDPAPAPTPRDGAEPATALPLAATAVAVRPTAMAPRVVFPPPPPALPEAEVTPLEPPVAPVQHRDRELVRLQDLLVTRPGRLVAIVGEAGSGRTSLLAALSTLHAEKPVAPAAPPADGQRPAAWLRAIDRRAPADAPIVLDGLPFGGGEIAEAATEMLVSASAGRRWILAVGPHDLCRLREALPAIAPLLDTVTIAPLDRDGLLEVVDGGLGTLAQGAGIAVGPGVTEALVRLACRYPTERTEPGRALAVAELAVAHAARLGRARVGEGDVAEVVADASSLPIDRLRKTDDERWADLAAALAARVIGQDAAAAQIVQALRRGWAGFHAARPRGALLLCGPASVGKAATAAALAECLYDGEAALVAADGGDDRALARLGAGARARPACVLLLRDAEKLSRDDLGAVSEALASGRLRDGEGRAADVSAAVVVLTTTLAGELFFKSATRTPRPATVLALAKSRLPPALWDGLDDRVCFMPLGEPDLRRVLALVALASCRGLAQERGIRYSVDAAVFERVLGAETDRSQGALPLRRAYQRLVEGPVAAYILAARLKPGASLQVTCDRDGTIEVTRI